MSRRLLVTVESPSGRRILAVPDDARVEDLVPSLVEVCEGLDDPAGWSLAPLGAGPFGGDQTLAESGLFPGALLLLIAPDPSRQGDSEPGRQPAADLGRRLTATLRSVGPNLPALAARPPSAMPDIQRLSDADYLQVLEAAIVAPAAGASTVVAVMSAHAGAGATTVTDLLATLLNTLRSDQVGAVDACPQSGALSHWMAPESGLSVPVYRALFEPLRTPEQVQAALFTVGPGLALLPAPADQRIAPAANEASWDRLIRHLRHLHNIVILDCGAGFNRDVARAALASADHVVLVSKSTSADLGRLGPTIESIRGQGRIVTVVANHAAKRLRATRSAAGVQQLTLAHEPKPAQRLKTRGFSWSDAPYSWQESIRELAAVLVGSGGAPPARD